MSPIEISFLTPHVVHYLAESSSSASLIGFCGVQELLEVRSCEALRYVMKDVPTVPSIQLLLMTLTPSVFRCLENPHISRLQGPISSHMGAVEDSTSICEAEDERAQATLDNLIEDQLHELREPSQSDECNTAARSQEVSELPAWRRAAIRIVTHRDFEAVIIMLTILDCFALAMYTPLQPPTNVYTVFMERTGALLLPA
jgi:hypothetical protein